MRWGLRIDRVGVILTVALAAGAIASLSYPVAGRAAVADAYCAGPPTNVAGRGSSGGPRFAQTFSPINGGYLSVVRLFVQEELHYNDTLSVQITPVNGSDLAPVFPVAPMATATVPDSSLTPSGSYPYLTEVAFVFSNPPAVLASSEYAIVLKRTDSSNVLGIGIVGNGSTGDPCPDGGFYDSPSDATPWTGPNPHDDAVFTTFVTGAPTPAPPPIAPVAPLTCKVPSLLGKTLKGAKKKIRSGNCKLGKVTKKEGASAKTGRVAKQNPKSGKTVAAGTKISVTLE
jgi:hypothetical protein